MDVAVLKNIKIIIYKSMNILSGRLQEIENKRKSQTFGSKSGYGRLREVDAYERFQLVI